MLDLLTVDEVAEALRLTPHTIRRMLKEGKLTGAKIGAGQQWRVRKTDLETYLEGSFQQNMKVGNFRDVDVEGNASGTSSKTIATLNALSDEISEAWEPGLSVKDVIDEIRS